MSEENEDKKQLMNELGLDKIGQTTTEIDVIRPIMDNDISQAKENIKEALDIVAETFKDLNEIARQAQHDRMYTAVATMLTSLVQANKTLAEIDMAVEKEKKKDSSNSSEISENNTYNQMFIGSTSELQSMIAKLKKEKNE